MFAFKCIELYKNSSTILMTFIFKSIYSSFFYSFISKFNKIKVYQWVKIITCNQILKTNYAIKPIGLPLYSIIKLFISLQIFGFTHLYASGKFQFLFCPWSILWRDHWTPATNTNIYGRASQWIHHIWLPTLLQFLEWRLCSSQ